MKVLQDDRGPAEVYQCATPPPSLLRAICILKYAPLITCFQLRLHLVKSFDMNLPAFSLNVHSELGIRTSLDQYVITN